MKLLFAIKSLNALGGGAERVLVDLVNGLDERGHHVQVLSFDPPGQCFYSLNTSVERLDLGISEPGEPTPRGKLFKSLPLMRRSILSAEPDIVVGFMHSIYVPLALALLGTKQCLVASEHTSAAHYRTRPLQRLLVGLAEHLAVSTTVPTAAIREEYRDAIKPRVAVMTNPLDLEKFRRVAEMPPKELPLLLSVGRLSEEKNHSTLIDAFAMIAAKFPEWRLKIVGEGKLRPQLEKQILRLGLCERVFLPGATKDVSKEYAASSLVVLPSEYEAFGMVAAEALASRRAVLAFDHCLGISDMIRHEANGLLVAAHGNATENLGGGLERLMSDSLLRERLAAAGPASVEKFSLLASVERWEKLLNQLHLETCGKN